LELRLAIPAASRRPRYFAIIHDAIVHGAPIVASIGASSF
jgi:hypothetical protein